MTGGARSGAPRRTAALSLAVAAIAINWYLAARISAYPAGFALSLLLLGAVPAVAAPVLWRRSWTELGLTLGDKQVGARLLAVGLPVAVLAGWLGAGSDALVLEYPLQRELTRAAQAFLPYAIGYALYYIGFEFLFRGYLLFGLADTIGPARANLLQAVLAVLAHVGKPGIEIVAAFPASLLFGWAALRTRSIWYVTLIHWLVGVSLDWAILGAR